MNTIPTFCIQCTQPVPDDRARRGAVTCSIECFQTRRAAKRRKDDAEKCRVCHRPSTPAQRGRYVRWEALQRRILGMPSLDILRDELPAIAETMKARGEKRFNEKHLRDLFSFLQDPEQGTDLRREPREDGCWLPAVNRVGDPIRERATEEADAVSA